jgi:chromosome segregation ATPase
MDRSKIKECQKVLRASKRKLEMQDSAMRRIKDDYEGRIAALETRLEEDAKIITDNQKTIKVLENEKTVLSAAVDARDGKLSKMNKLQTRVDSLKTEVNNGRSTMRDLDAMNAKFNAIRADLEKTKLSEKMYMEEAKRLATELEVSDGKTRREQNHAEKCKAQLESANKKCQKLKVERNTYKQRADSLAKDMSRVCRNGMGVENIEVIMQDNEKMTHELSLIKTQKRKALDELEESRRMHQHSIEAQMKACVCKSLIGAMTFFNQSER